MGPRADRVEKFVRARNQFRSKEIKMYTYTRARRCSPRPRVSSPTAESSTRRGHLANGQFIVPRPNTRARVFKFWRIILLRRARTVVITVGGERVLSGERYARERRNVYGPVDWKRSVGPECFRIVFRRATITRAITAAIGPDRVT